MRKYVNIRCLCYTLLFFLQANAYLLLARYAWARVPFFVLAILLQLLVGVLWPSFRRFRFRVVHHGALCLLMFVYALLPSLAYHAVLLVRRGLTPSLGWSVLFAASAFILLFWNGILSVYLASYQLGIRHRALGILCGLVPILNLVMLRRIIIVVVNEISTELAHDRKNEARLAERLCRTKYPILLVHGVFFRDWKHFNYWGRIPEELRLHGATVYYGNHQSAASVADSAAEITVRVQEILRETGCDKVNIIAHSKGGLDCRFAMAELGLAPMVASLTTVNTPHRGCLFAERLLDMAPPEMQRHIAQGYERAAKKLGDSSPDFLAAVTDLTAEVCTARDAAYPAPDGVFCQSIGSKMNNAASAPFPLNLCYRFVQYFDGENDGLVGEGSFAFGERYRLLSVEGKRGISHGDVIDLFRENLLEFDVREFYVELVGDLKARGM
ncbi:MAG: triacylglycerol lipase [Ruminococcaceae bacterium]|nr:triacylglycerol lipase [Oscillospiraceae bacterium]